MATRSIRTAKRGGPRTAARRRTRRKVPTAAAGYGGITPHLNVRGAAEAIDFYRTAFGATESLRLAYPDGKVAHAELRIFGQIVMLGEEVPAMGRPAPDKVSAVSLFSYVPDVDRAIARATAAGATVTMPAQDMFWGDRYGTLCDPFGHCWGLATHRENVSPREMQKRWQATLAAS